MAGVAPPPTALIAQRVVLSTKLVDGYPQPSLPPDAAGIVMPGVHDGALDAPQLFPMVPLVDAQSDPLQQRLGAGAVCGVHVRPGAHPPVESQRQPFMPTMQVVGAPPPALPPPSAFPFVKPESLVLPPSLPPPPDGNDDEESLLPQ